MGKLSEKFIERMERIKQNHHTRIVSEIQSIQLDWQMLNATIEMCFTMLTLCYDQVRICNLQTHYNYMDIYRREWHLCFDFIFIHFLIQFVFFSLNFRFVDACFNNTSHTLYTYVIAVRGGELFCVFRRSRFTQLEENADNNCWPPTERDSFAVVVVVFFCQPVTNDRVDLPLIKRWFVSLFVSRKSPGLLFFNS